SRGRLLLGIGSGVREEELAWLGADPAPAREDAAAAVAGVRRAFADGVVTLGVEEHPFRFTSARGPHPSLWVAGSLDRAAAQGASVVGAVGHGFTREAVDRYWEAYRAVGGSDPWVEAPWVGTTRHVVVAETDE